MIGRWLLERPVLGSRWGGLEFLAIRAARPTNRLLRVGGCDESNLDGGDSRSRVRQEQHLAERAAGR